MRETAAAVSLRVDRDPLSYSLAVLRKTRCLDWVGLSSYDDVA